LIECREITKTWHYGGEPALHIVVFAVMNCPSGPFRSEFLISNWSLACSFHCVLGSSRAMEKKLFVCLLPNDLSLN